MKLKELISFEHRLETTCAKVLEPQVILSRIYALSSILQKQSGQTVGIGINDPLNFIVSLLSSLHANKQILLLPNFKEETIKVFQERCNFFIGEDYFKNIKIDLVDNEKLLELTNSKVNPECKILMYTSGSSGEPKRVEKKWEHLFNEVEVLEEVFGTSKDYTFHSTVSHQHIYGLLFRVIWPLLKKYRLCVENLKYQEDLSCQDQRGRILITSPAFLKRLTNKKIIKSAYASLFSSGGVLPFHVKIKALDIFGIIPIEVYGSTETGGIGYRQTIEEEKGWKYFKGVKGSKSKEDTLIVTSNYFFDPLIDTGDRVDFDREYFQLLGRANRIVNIEEKRICLDEIDKHLKLHSIVKESYSVKLFKKKRELVASVIVLDDRNSSLGSSRENILSLKKHLKSRFDDIVVPKLYRFVETIEKNEQGKISAKDIERLFDE